MTSTGYRRAKELFLQAVELPADERGALLAGIREESPSLHERVNQLLEAHEAGAELEHGPVRANDVPSGPRDVSGTTFGDKSGQFSDLTQASSMPAGRPSTTIGFRCAKSMQGPNPSPEDPQ